MYISKLSIRNFRNFCNVSLSFGEGVNTIIGENGSGKTNILQALRLLIDDSLPRGVRFYESDFNRKLNNWKGHWIVIQLEFSELDVSEEAQALAMWKVGDMENYDNKKGSYSLIIRPNETTRRELFEYSVTEIKNQIGLQELIDAISLDDYEALFFGRGNVDFSIDANYLRFVGDFENIIFPNPDDQMGAAYGMRLYGFSLPKELSCTFVKALRDVESDLRSYKDSPLLSLLRGKEKNIDATKKDSISAQIEALNADISNLGEVKSVSEGIALSLKGAVGEIYAPNIEIKSELPSDMGKLLQSLKLWVGDPDQMGYKGRLGELSLGGANLLYLSLKLLEYRTVKSLERIANFLLIEEPEAHIHTHVQRALFQKLQTHKTQIIITTHSTHISSVSEIKSMNILARGENEAQVYVPSMGLNNLQVDAIERYLDAVRTNLLFAKGVILVEGDAEQIIIPQLVKKVFGVSLDELGLSIINIGSTGFENIAILFHDDRLRKKCAIITDSDQSIIPLSDDKQNDTEEQRKYRNSQESGERRRLKLDDFTQKNQWLSVFYADYTLEVDFLKAGNSVAICKVVKMEYKQAKEIDQISEKINAAEIAISGKETLRLAEKFGKGWFALMVSKEIDHLTHIPRYIINAIAHTCFHVSDKMLLEMVHVRLYFLSKQPCDGDATDYEGIQVQLKQTSDVADALQLYRANLPNDTLSQLLQEIEQNRLLS